MNQVTGEYTPATAGATARSCRGSRPRRRQATVGSDLRSESAKGPRVSTPPPGLPTWPLNPRPIVPVVPGTPPVAATDPGDGSFDWPPAGLIAGGLVALAGAALLAPPAAPRALTHRRERVQEGGTSPSCTPQRSSTRSATCSAIASEEVAAGEGALRTATTRPEARDAEVVDEACRRGRRPGRGRRRARARRRRRAAPGRTRAPRAGTRGATASRAARARRCASARRTSRWKPGQRSVAATSRGATALRR